ncbi:MAG TPA: hypothetical protein ENN67_00280 [Firmicutes bacterium]|nr:hypothetical protein [Bacillota bacterium]
MMRIFRSAIFVSLVAVLLSGCGFGSSDFGMSLGYYMNPGPSIGYYRPPTDLFYSQLGCEITWPPNFTRAKWDETIWIYGVIWREGAAVDMYSWDGPEWRVNNERVGESFYRYDKTFPEVWVRFPFDSFINGPGQHRVTLTAWDRISGGYIPVYDSITIVVE